jgi:hypothetical protein
MTNIKKTILDIVTENRITMIPRWKFVTYSLLGIVGFVFTFLLTVFVISLVLFVLSRYGFLYMPLFGMMATLHTLSAVPLLLCVCAIGLICVMEIISRQYPFSFKRPIIVTLLSVTVCTMIAGFMVSRLGVHDAMRAYAQGHHIAMMERMYERPRPFRKKDGLDVIRGEVREITDQAFVLKGFDGKIVTATIASSSRFIPVLIGDDVVIAGKFVDELFEIVMMKKLSSGNKRRATIQEKELEGVRSQFPHKILPTMQNGK